MCTVSQLNAVGIHRLTGLTWFLNHLWETMISFMSYDLGDWSILASSLISNRENYKAILPWEYVTLTFERVKLEHNSSDNVTSKIVN